MPPLNRHIRPIDRAVPRREVLLGGLGLAAALLAGCSSSGGGNSPTVPLTVGGSRTGAGPFPVTVAGKEGSVTLRSAPKRVVAVGYLRDADLALALGAPLAGAARNSVFASGLAPWQKPTTSPELFDTADGLPFEQIAALRPDLILATDDYTLAKDYANLAKIAPTLSYLQGVGADSWPSITTRAGQVLGTPAQAASLIAATQAKVASAKQQNSVLAGKTFTFGPVSSLDSIYTINDVTDASSKFFAQLGMSLSPKVTSLPQSSTPRRAKISLEQLSILDADVVILSYPDPTVRSKLESQAVFQELAAVKRGSYIALDMAAAVAVAFPSALSIPYGLDATVPRLVAAARKA